MPATSKRSICGWARCCRGTDIGLRKTFADLGQTIAENFGVGPLAHGVSFLEAIRVEHP